MENLRAPWEHFVLDNLKPVRGLTGIAVALAWLPGCAVLIYHSQWKPVLLSLVATFSLLLLFAIAQLVALPLFKAGEALAGRTHFVLAFPFILVSMAFAHAVIFLACAGTLLEAMRLDAPLWASLAVWAFTVRSPLEYGAHLRRRGENQHAFEGAEAVATYGGIGTFAAATALLCGWSIRSALAVMAALFFTSLVHHVIAFFQPNVLNQLQLAHIYKNAAR